MRLLRAGTRRRGGRSRSRLHRLGFWLAASLLASPLARAHPLGASSINRYLDFQYTGGGLFRVAYVLDFAEGPAYAEMDALDADHDGAVTPVEQRRYLDSRLPVLVSSCTVEIDGERVTPSIVASSVDTPPGEGGLETLRIVAELAAFGRAPLGSDLVLHVHDDGFSRVPGWREIHAEDARDDAPALPADGGATRPTRVTDSTFSFRARPPDAPGHAVTARLTARRWLLVVALAAISFLAACIVALRARRRAR